MAAAGFIIDASEADALMRDLAEKHAKILLDAKRITLDHARRMRALVRAAAPNGGHVPGFANSINTKTTQYVAGIECTVETRHPLGAILENGGPRSRPWNMFGAAADVGIPAWEKDLTESVANFL